MTTFDGVDFSGDLAQLVFDQLAKGMHRGREDSAPGDWLDRAWHALPPAERSPLTAAVHQALTHPNPAVRSEAVRLLDGNPSMANPTCLLELVEQHWDLFKGLRGPLDSPEVDRGHAMAQLTAHHAAGPRGELFRQTMARDPVYGENVLAALAYEETSWVIEHIHELVTPELDPNDVRLNVLVFNLQQQPAMLRRAVANLLDRQPNLRERLAQVIRASVRSRRLRANLLRQTA